MTGAETKIPTPAELEAMLERGELKLLGMGSRRACYKIPGTKLCVKCYRSDQEILEGKIQGRSVKPLPLSVIREIKKNRFNEKNNTGC